VFDPNPADRVAAEQLGSFINDAIARSLAGVTSKGRPVFLKIVYHGPRAMEELVRYDPHLVVGILGGSAGTTYDAFKLLAEAKKYGARAALYGRKINSAECQLAFVRFLRLIADGEISPEEAVRAYHGVLQKLKIAPKRTLEKDMELQTGVMSYGRGTTKVFSLPTKKETVIKGKCDCGGGCCKQEKAYPVLETGEPDFTRMTVAQKIEYQRQRRKEIWG
jgi:hypothetical protein